VKCEYGQTVRVASSASSRCRPGSTGAVVGYRTADNPIALREFDQEIGTGIYLIEFEEYPRGIEIPEMYIMESNGQE